MVIADEEQGIESQNWRTSEGLVEEEGRAGLSERRFVSRPSSYCEGAVVVVCGKGVHLKNLYGVCPKAWTAVRCCSI